MVAGPAIELCARPSGLVGLRGLLSCARSRASRPTDLSTSPESLAARVQSLEGRFRMSPRHTVTPFPSDRALAEMGLFFALVSIAGVGVPMIWPDEKVLGIAFLAVGMIGCVLVATLWVVRFCRARGVRLGTVLASIGTILIIMGGIVGLIGAFKMDTASNEHSDAASPKSPLDNLIQVTCDVAEMPLIVPQNTLFELVLNHQFITSGGVFQWTFSRPGTPINIADDRPHYVYLCKFVNYGVAAVLNFETEISIDFGGSGKSAKVTTPLQANIAGSGGVFEFYVRNYSDQFDAQITLPVRAHGQMAGTTEWQSFRLASGRFTGFILPPFNPKKAR
jgi:hypothetical protein